MLVNGKPADSIPIDDRGFLYGDGVFRTLRLHCKRPANWSRQYQKLRHDCKALGLACPEPEVLLEDMVRLSCEGEAILRITVTRGVGPRGYAPPTEAHPTRIVAAYPPPPPCFGAIDLHLCQIRLAHQPRLAGIKHLNRLENVLAAQECQAAGKQEGVLCDEEGTVISGTRSNLFAVIQGKLLTPDLSRCGVAGVQRERVLDWAMAHAIPSAISRLALSQVVEADEVFLVNSVFGIWPVRSLANRIYVEHRFADALRPWLNDAQN